MWPSKPKIKSETLRSDFKHGGLENVNIQKKIGLQCSWVRRLYDKSFRDKSSHYKYLNNMLFTFGKTKTPLCSFFYSYNETIRHIFLECICVKQQWNHLRLFLTSDISLPTLTPQTTVFGFINGIENSFYKITNHILLIFKLHVYKSS